MRLRSRGVRIAAGIFIAALTMIFATASLAQNSLPFGVNGGWDWVNLINGVSNWNVLNPTPTSPPVPEDANGNPTSDFGVTLIDSRKNMPFAGPDQLGINEDISGTYLVSFQGKATIVPNTEITNGPIGATLQNQSYDAGANTTTAQVVLHPGFGLLQIVFTNTQATATSATNTGVTGLKVIRPGYPLNTSQVFTNGSLQYFKNAAFVNDRFLGPDGIGSYNDFTNQTVNSVTWAGRVKVTDVHQQGTQVENSNFQQAQGVAWEYIIEFANATNTDIWINIPDLAPADYIQNLATLILNGNQYTAGLNSNLHVYFEQGNEDWNSSTQPAIANSINASNAGLTQPQEYVAHTIANAKIFQSVFNQAGATGRVRPVVQWQYTTQLEIFDALQWWEHTNNDKVSKYIYGVGEAPYYEADDYSSVQAIFDSQYDNSDRTRRDFIGWQAVAAYHGLKEVGYESGPSLSIGPSAAAIRDSRIIPSVHHHFLDNWYAVGGDLVNYFAAQDHVNYYSDWLTVEDFEHYDTPTFAGVLGVLNASQPPLTAGQVLPWSVGQTVVLDPSQVVNSPFGSDLAPNSAITISQGTDNLYLLRSTGSGTYSIALTAQGASSSTPLDVYVDDTKLGTVDFGTSTSTSSSLTFNAGVGFHGLSLVATSSSNVVFPANSGAIAITLSSGSGTAVVPSAPQNLSIVSGDGQAALTWATTASATSYTVSRSTTSGGPFTAVATVNTNHYTNTGLTDGTTYYYVVQASNSVGTGANSPQASVYPGPTSLPSAPAAPTVTAAGGDGGLFYSPGIAIVSWSPVANASGYKVYKSTNGGSFSQVNQAYNTDGYNQQANSPQAALTWTDRFVNNGDDVSYTVSAVNANGEGPQSSPGSATATLAVRPAPALSITQRDGFNLLTWVPNPLWNPQFAPAFNVKRGTQSGGPYTTIIQINTDDAYDYTATPGTTYYYVVTQVNSAGEGAPSNEVSGESSTAFTPGNCGGDTTPVPYPSIPTNNAGCLTSGGGGPTQPINTSTGLSISPNTSTLTEGESYTLTATVSPASGSTTPSGNVVFTIGSATQSVSLSNGVATYNGAAPSSTGTLSLSAQYQGNSSFNSSNSSTLSETITSGGGPGGTTQTQVNLSSAGANTIGFTNDNSSFSGGGIDGDGNAYSTNQTGSSLTFQGITYNFSAPDQKDVFAGGGNVSIALPSGNYSTLYFLGLAVDGSQTGSFNVNYTSGSPTTLSNQQLSDWFNSQGYSGEAIAATYQYRDNNQGAQSGGPLHLYAYSITLDSSRTATSLTLPNNQDIVVAAVTLVGSGGTPSPINTSTGLSISPNTSTLTEGESYTLTATVSPASGSTTPSGNVVFTIGSATQSVSLSNGVATYNGAAPSSTGTLSLSAQYQGNSSFNSSSSNTLSETITSGGGGGSIAIPNYSFEQGGAGYNVPSNWTFASSGTTSNNYAVQYISNSTSPAAEDGSDYWAPGDFNPSSTPYGTSTATLTTSASVGTFAANTTYKLTVALADPADGTSSSQKSIGFQLLANGNVVANFASTSIPQGGNFQDYSLTFDTASNTSAVGHPITIALVYSYSGQYNRNAYFDNVRLTTTADSGGSSPSQVSLSGVANTIGLTNDNSGFSGGGVDNDGNAYSANQTGSSLTDSQGALFNFGTPGVKDVVNGSNAPVIPLTSGKYSTLKLLGLAVNGSQSGTFLVTYSDNSTDQFPLTLSDWFNSQNYNHETVAATYPYRDNNQGAQSGGPLNLYEYTLGINNGKTVKSLTLPNNQNIVVVAATLLP